MWSPPMCTERSGLRAISSNSRGAFATCSSTNSGSRKTFSPSTFWPAARKYSTASGSMNSTPRSNTSIASSLRISYRGIWLTYMRLQSLDDSRTHPNISFVEQEFQPAKGTQTIDRGAQLLALVLEADAPRELGELAADAGLPKSTASRLLSALERNGLVEQEGLRGRFRAGPVLLRFATRVLPGR